MGSFAASFRAVKVVKDFRAAAPSSACAAAIEEAAAVTALPFARSTQKEPRGWPDFLCQSPSMNKKDVPKRTFFSFNFLFCSSSFSSLLFKISTMEMHIPQYEDFTRVELFSGKPICHSIVIPFLSDDCASYYAHYYIYGASRLLAKNIVAMLHLQPSIVLVDTQNRFQSVTESLTSTRDHDNHLCPPLSGSSPLKQGGYCIH